MVEKKSTEKPELSIQERIDAHKEGSGLFCVVQGARFSGKTTLVGTLPGKTLLVQAAKVETNSRSARKLASDLGNDLSICKFVDLDDLIDIIEKFKTSDLWDHLYIDGMSAISDMLYDRDDIQKLLAAGKSDKTWGAYRLLGSELVKFILGCKDVVDTTAKNIFVTLATKEKKNSDGEVIEMQIACKGNVGIETINKVCPNVLPLRRIEDEEGESVRQMIIRTHDVYEARIDGILDTNTQIPAVLGNPSLDSFLKLAKAAMKNKK